MAKLLYFVLLAAVVWKAHADQDDQDQDFIPDESQNNQEIKCGKYYAQYPNPEDCGSYIVCHNGQKSIKSCPTGEHYNFKTIRCAEPCEAYCNKTLSCECKWSTCGLDDVCFQEPIVGGCRNRVVRYFFNKRTGQCERFGYSGCMGNENNFKTLEECQQKCSKAKPKPKFVCLFKNGNFPNPDNCETYFQCTDFKPQLKTCEAGLHFSDKPQRCEKPCDSYCDKSLACQCKWPTCGLKDLCSLLPETGPCRAGFRNYYFNRRTGQCETFVYGGCPGNENNFRKKEDCEKTCSKSEEPPVNESVEPTSEESTEPPVNEYVEPTSEESTEPPVNESVEPISEESTESSVDEIPHLPEEELVHPHFECVADGLYTHPKTCRSFVKCSKGVPKLQTCPENHHFNNKTKRCETPCKAQCDRTYACKCKWPTCGTNALCFLPAKPGPCKGKFERFHFDKRSGECKAFDYGGCLGNENNFVTKKFCERKCKHSLDICKLPYKIGPCKGNFERFYFNHKEGKCQKFTFGGCKANHNNFKTLEECETSCLQNKEPEEYPLVGCPGNDKWGHWDNCSLYYECEGGKELHLRACPSGQHFNNALKRCTAPCDAFCEPTIAFSEENICRLPAEKGTCKASIPKYFFNHEKGECQQFIYGGCNGNANNFDTREECERSCLRRADSEENICRLPAEKGTCKASIPKYFFNHEKGECQQFIYGGYNGNANNFDSREECERSCLRRADSEENICRLPAEKGPCKAYFPKYFFNHEKGECHQFFYGGCNGNANNFDSREECERSCLKSADSEENICRLPAEKGPCKASIPKYFFNHEKGECQQFIYGGCNGNANNFDSREECEMSCLRSADSEENICRLPAEKGPCKAYFPQYFFNHEKGECQQFIYGGCKGNANNFDSREECERSCLKNAGGGGYDNPFKVQCSPPRCNIGCTIDYETKPCPSCKCVLGGGGEKSADSECAEDGYFADLSSCNHFIHCSDGRKSVKPCPPTLHFNEKTKQCDSPCDARCDPSLAYICGWPMGAALSGNCGEHEHYDLVGAACQRNCKNYKDWIIPCRLMHPGCVCDRGYVRSSQGQCILKAECETDN